MKLIDFDELEKLKDEDIDELEDDWDGNFFAEFADKVSDDVEFNDEDYLAVPVDDMESGDEIHDEEDEEAYLSIPDELVQQREQELILRHQEEEKEASKYVLSAKEEDIYDLSSEENPIPLEQKRARFGKIMGLEDEESELETDTVEEVSSETVVAEQEFVREPLEPQESQALEVDFEKMADVMAEEYRKERTITYDPMEYAEEDFADYEQFKDIYVRKHILQEVEISEETAQEDYEEKQEDVITEEVTTWEKDITEEYTEKEITEDVTTEEELIVEETVEKAIEEVENEEVLETVSEDESSFVDSDAFYEIEVSEGVLKKRTLPRKIQEEMEPDETGQEKKVQEPAKDDRKENQIENMSVSLPKGRKIKKLKSSFENEYLEILEEGVYKVKDHSRKKPKKKLIREKKSIWDEEDETPDNPFKEFFGLLISIAVVVVVTFVLVEFVGQRTEVNGDSMESTLHDEDNLIVDKITYAFNEPERFDIVVFPYKSVNASEEVYYIKRIIGLPGEKVQISNGFIYINGEILVESYGKNNNLILNPGRAEKEIQLGDDEYFVLGDNRNNSSDSREIGNIKRDDIIGRAWLRIWPLSDFGILKHQ